MRSARDVKPADPEEADHSMLPPKTDPRWRTLVQTNTEYRLKGLATRMMLTRARLMGSKKDEESVNAAIEVAFAFFTKNADTVRDDVHAIFG